jgi:Zn-dependent protease
VPLPPLDGSHIFYHLLPPALGARYRAIGRYGFVVLLLTFAVPSFGVVWNVLLWPADTAARLTLSAVSSFTLPAAVR